MSQVLQVLEELLQTVEIGEPQDADGLRVFGLRWQHRGGLNYLTLDEGLAAGTLEITEVSTTGSVPTLKLLNKADAMVFLMAGEQLIGAKQNRVLNASLVVAGRSELPVPVSCVEAGRWAYRSDKFAAAGTSTHGYLRMMMAGHATAGYRREGRPTSDQAKVWAEVARKLGTMQSSSPTFALHQAYEDHRQRLNAVVEQIHVPPDCHGVAFAVAGRIAGVDLFDQPSTLSKLWPKLVRAHVLDALEEPESPAAQVTGDAVREWLQCAERAKAEPFKSPGLGMDVRLEGERVLGAGLVVDDQLVHLELFCP